MSVGEWRGGASRRASLPPEELRARRRTLGLTQHELSAALGVTSTTLARWERGERRISSPGSVRLALERLESGGQAPNSALSRQAMLPNLLSSFVGREHEIADISRLLGSSRLLTLIGVGGVGKTRVALQVAAENAHCFEGGIAFVDLSAVVDASLVVSSIVQSLALSGGGSEPSFNQLVHHLRDRQLLLVLDNFEQVLPASPSIAALVAACPKMHVLITSRAPLRVSGEQTYSVAPLQLPENVSTQSLESLRRTEAVRLFVERARSARPDFELTVHTAPDVVKICHRLDGLPLAIELAAARLRVLPPASLLARLGRRLELLVDGPRDRPARHQTLRAAIAWSYGLLTESEQTLFRSLSVFTGGWTLNAAEAVSHLPGTFASLTALVEQGLVKVDEQPHGQPRFRFLETLREFALERLEAAGEEPGTRARHAAYFLTLALELGTEERTRSSDAQAHLHRLEQEHDNLRGALRWSIDSCSTETALRLADALRNFWPTRGYYAEGHRWITEVLGLSGAHGSTELRASLLEASALCLDYLGDYAAAHALGTQVLSIARALANPMLQARGLHRVALSLAHLGDLAAARPLYEQAVEVCRAAGHPIPEAAYLHNLAWLAIQQSDYALAQARATESLSVARGLNSPNLTGLALKDLGYAACGLADLAAAQAALDEALSLAEQAGSPWLTAAVCDGLAHLAAAAGRNAEARRWVADALAWCRRIGDRRGIIQGLECLASVLATDGELQRAVQAAGAADSLRAALKAPLSIRERAQLEGWIGRAQHTLGQVAFQAAWALGRGSSFDDVSAVTLEPVASPAPARAATVGLTRRQRAVAELVARGLSNQRIAAELVISERTVESHISHILDRLDLHSRTQLAAWVLAPEKSVSSLRTATDARLLVGA